ncbi:hypothetical protein FIBSPDRAFT_896805 [Athelia psychrophila]|uniref:Uncharacterized protein n=1 Tax=Athelia psychrophila TaxID=1759441 RepID=A0A166D019_9AGAM|nr:hypothetical protein FIBSPDRAFT_896805 [Fibularhizoctonia sp. CBS 109695]
MDKQPMESSPEDTDQIPVNLSDDGWFTGAESPRDFMRGIGRLPHLDAGQRRDRLYAKCRPGSAAAQWVSSLDDVMTADWDEVVAVFDLRWPEEQGQGQGGMSASKQRDSSTALAGQKLDSMPENRAPEGGGGSALGLIPDIAPSPQSHWIDLHDIDDLRQSADSPGPVTYSLRMVPEEPPAPLSYWIDLHPLEDLSHCDLHSESLPVRYPTREQAIDSTNSNMVPEGPPAPLSYWIDLHSAGDADAERHHDDLHSPGLANPVLEKGEEPAAPVSYWVEELYEGDEDEW